MSQLLIPPPESEYSAYPTHGIGGNMYLYPSYIGWVRTKISLARPTGVWAYWDGARLIRPGEELISNWQGEYKTSDASGTEVIEYQDGTPTRVAVPITKTFFDKDGKYLIRQRVVVVGWKYYPAIITNIISQGKKVVRKGG